MKLDSCQGKTANKYKDVKLKLLKINENIKFNKKCLDCNLVPNYVNIKIKNKSPAAQKTLQTAQKYWIKNEIKHLYTKKTLLNKSLYETHLELLNKLHPSIQEDIISKLEYQISKTLKKKKETIRKKIDRLYRSQHPDEEIKCKHTFFPTVTNLTNIVFDSDEVKLLNKGLNYNFPNNKKNGFFNELLQAEAVVNSLPTEELRNNARVLVNRKAKSLLNNPYRMKQATSRYKSERQVAISIRDKLTMNDATVTKADKGNSLVIMHSQVYNNKVEAFLTENNIKKIDIDPTALYSKEINKIISKSKDLLSSAEIKFSKITNPSAPCLRGLPKIHKENMPIRPLVNFIPSPAYNISKKLEHIIRNNIVLKNSHSLRNSMELVQRLNDTQFNCSYTLASLDIVNLYTNVPVDETINILQENLINHSNLTQTAIDDLINLTKAVLKQNYFKFNNNFYSQKDGLAMGSPLSGILAEVFLNQFENSNLWSDKNKFRDKILFYSRYVDDTLVAFKGNTRQLKMFTNYLNEIHHNVKFTLETEIDNKINYLDLSIYRENNKLKYKIYRKPTTTAQTIHASSHHPHNQKMAAYNSLVHRMLNIPMSPEDFSDEVSAIKHIAIMNGYKSSIVDNIMKKHRNKFNNSDSRPNRLTTNKEQNSTKYVSMEYGSTSLNHTIKNELAKSDVSVSYRTSNKLGSLLKPRHTEVKNLEDSTGVYKLSCDDCPKFYIGQTTRSFKKRFKEHLPSINSTKLSNTRSAFALHLIDNNHNYSSFQNNVEILNVVKKSRMLDCLEEFHIYKAMKTEPTNVLNEQTSFKSNAIYDTAMGIIDADGKYRKRLRHNNDNS